MLRSKPRPLALAASLAWASLGFAAAPATIDVMPLPADVRIDSGRVAVTAQFAIVVNSQQKWTRVDAALARFRQRWQARTGLTFTGPTNGRIADVLVECSGEGTVTPELHDDESYVLEIGANGGVLRAPQDLGVLRGLETLQQLLRSDADGWFLPCVTIRDQPRFAWRGLLVDPSRHWLPPETIVRTLDAMAVVKLNVLHLHLTDDQGFRIESKKYPKLHEQGSDGLFYTQAQMREIVAHAAGLGIRVVPEFDVPGHATAWLVGYPDLASAPGPYRIERRWGIKDPVFDPTNEKTYALLDGFLGEMAALFPDAYVHIGGDENNGKHWSANAGIQAFIAQHELKNNEGLHTWFNTRLRAILGKHGKKLVGWDEILHPDLPKDSVVHSWRGAKGLAAAAKGGFPVLLSNGYYLDHALSAAKHYANDPVPAGTPLTPDEQARVLGGEACMWGEWVTAETIDSRLWPRAAVVAERLWSPRDVNNVPDLYRRLALTSRRLEEAGSFHLKNPAAMLRNYAGDRLDESQFAALRTFTGLVETGALGVRSYAARGTVLQATPLNTFADCALPESDAVREFSHAVDALLFTRDQRNTALAGALARQLDAWRSAARQVAVELSPLSPRLRELEPAARAVADACEVGREVLTAWRDGKMHDEAWAQRPFAALAAAAQPNSLGVTLPMLPSLRLLVAAVVAEPQRTTLPAAEWRAQVEKLATPPPPPRKL